MNKTTKWTSFLHNRHTHPRTDRAPPGRVRLHVGQHRAVDDGLPRLRLRPLEAGTWCIDSHTHIYRAMPGLHLTYSTYLSTYPQTVEGNILSFAEVSRNLTERGEGNRLRWLQTSLFPSTNRCVGGFDYEAVLCRLDSFTG
jgi:hypothetical protein